MKSKKKKRSINSTKKLNIGIVQRNKGTNLRRYMCLSSLLCFSSYHPKYSFGIPYILHRNICIVNGSENYYNPVNNNTKKNIQSQLKSYEK